MAEHCHEQPVRISWIDGDLRNLLAIAKAKMRPGLAGVDGFVDAIADGKVGPLQAFAASHVNNVRVRRRYGNGPDGSGGLIVEDGVPGAAVVVGLPHAAIHCADVEDIRLAGNAGASSSASAAKWSNHAPVHVDEKFRVVGGGLG